MIYFKYIRMVLKSFAQYRLSMWLTLTAQFFVSFFAFIGMYLLFERFGTINGWSFGEVSICFAVIQTSFAVTECFARGFDTFSQQIIAGDFDRVLLRPRSTVLQVFGSSFEVTRFGIMRFFTFIIPFGCINYLPLLYITGKAGQHGLFYMLTPLFGILFIVPCIFAWRFGVRRYLSTGN